MAGEKTGNNRRAAIAAIAAAAAVALIAAAALIVYMMRGGGTVAFSETQGELAVSNAFYTITFDAASGAILSIADTSSGETVTAGNRERMLWRAFMADESSFSGAEAESFSYSWSGKDNRLQFDYGGEVAVKVTFDFAEGRSMVAVADVDNRSGKTLASFRFPYEMRLDTEHVRDGLLPMLPGAKLDAAFFTESNSYEAQYPGVMFASYLAVRTAGGSLAVYDIHREQLATVDLGFKSQVDSAGISALVHNYKTWIAPGSLWQSPAVVLHVGGDYPASIAGYRADNAMDAYAGLADKLGEQRRAYYEAPLYKLDVAALGDQTWTSLQSGLLGALAHRGILHPVAFQRGGHDENYPDFMPPDPQWGTEGELREFVLRAQQLGHKVVPYTNFSWWGVSAPTLRSLPDGVTMQDIVVNRENGLIVKEDYGPHSGYVMDVNHPFVRARIAEEHTKLLEQAGFDGIFEDQWGARPAPYVYNGTAPVGADASNAYFEGVRDYFSSLDHSMFVEVGIDVLADDSVAFLGTNYLWDILEYRTKTAPYTEYYPMAGMLARDKVLMYQHNLAFETMTNTKEMLRWNLAQGFQLSGDLRHGTDNPWIDVAGVFQRYVLAHYADELVGGYEQLDGGGATLTTIGDFAVTANWRDDAALETAEGRFALAPGGVEVVGAADNAHVADPADGDGASPEEETVQIRAGVYTRYNGIELDPGDHYVVELSGADRVRLFQPNGNDTTIAVMAGDGWPHARAAAYTYGGELVAELPTEREGDLVVFDYIGQIGERKVGYVLIESADEASEIADVPFAKRQALVNMALGKPIVSTTDTTQDFPASRANDGDHFTYWESVPQRFPQSLTVDLGQPQTIGKLALTLPPLAAWEAREQEIEVLVSGDGVKFTAVLAAQTYTFDPESGNRLELELESGLTRLTEARYVRVTVTGNTGWPAAQISEFEVY